MITIILAGGEGKRFKMNYPKVCVKVRGMPMIVRAINNAILLKSEFILVVLNEKNQEKVKSVIQQYVKNKNVFFIVQPKPMGTAHAVKCCMLDLERRNLDPFDKILILNSDQPQLSFYTLNTFVKWNNSNDSRVLSCKVNNPSGFSRLIRNKRFGYEIIKEEKDCNEEEIKIPYVCAGVYMISYYQIHDNINSINNNNQQKEFHITDLLNIIKPDIYMLESKFQKELVNVNDLETLRKLNN